jgi:hypothetical protein
VGVALSLPRSGHRSGTHTAAGARQ